MKYITILIFTLFALNVQSQQDTGVVYLFDSDTANIVVEYNYLWDSEVLYICDLKGDLNEYVKQCYNDSTYTKIHKANDGWCIFHPTDPPSDCIRPDHWIEEWLHREATFIGFIEFLNKKN